MLHFTTKSTLFSPIQSSGLTSTDRLSLKTSTTYSKDSRRQMATWETSTGPTAGDTTKPKSNIINSVAPKTASWALVVETFIISSVLPETRTKVSRIVITSALFSSDFVKRRALTTQFTPSCTLSTFIICNLNWILHQTVSLYLQSKGAICGGLLANVLHGNS